jgi:hypothetical protein
MKTKFSFSKKPHTSLLLAIATLLLLPMQSAIFAGSGTWLSMPGSGDWNLGTNWSSGTVPNGSSDTATFAVSNQTAVDISAITTVDGITFNSGASAFTITVNPVITLNISGTGITNSSGITQNFVTAVGGGIAFTNNATAGSMTSFTNNGSTSGVLSGASTQFFDTSTAGSGSFTNNAATVSGAGGGFTQFIGTDATHFSTAGSAAITNNGATVSGAGAGSTQFAGTSTAGSAAITNNGGTVSGAAGGFTLFGDSSKAGSATLVANGGVGQGGLISFQGSSTGDMSTVKVYDNGSLDISGHNPGSVTIGSLEGSGNVFLGGNNLTVGSNNLSKTFSGVMQDGGTGGSLTKIGTGTFTFNGFTTYTA